jgi:hypothetical protein
MIRRPMIERYALAALVVAPALTWTACGGARAGDPPLANRDAAPAATGVRAIDWRNRAYALTGLGAVAVKDGRAEFALDDNGKVSATGETSASFRVEPPLFADIDGDGADDAVISTALGTGGTGQFSSVAVYALRGGRVVSLGDIPGGDRGDGGIRRIALDGRAVIVERNVLAEGDGACCASTWRRERWIWRGGALVEDPAARGPLLPVK